jgi:hypothetical protein
MSHTRRLAAPKRLAANWCFKNETGMSQAAHRHHRRGALHDRMVNDRDPRVSASRRHQPAASRKYRPFVDGMVKGANPPFDALQDPPSEQAGSVRKRSLAEGVCCARRGQSRANLNFCFGWAPGLSQRSPRSAPRAFAISRLGHQVLDSHHWGGAPIALLLPLQYAYRLRPAVTQAWRELHDLGGRLLAACATCDPRHSGRRRNVPHL